MSSDQEVSAPSEPDGGEKDVTSSAPNSDDEADDDLVVIPEDAEDTGTIGKKDRKKLEKQMKEKKKKEEKEQKKKEKSTRKTRGASVQVEQDNIPKLGAGENEIMMSLQDLSDIMGKKKSSSKLSKEEKKKKKEEEEKKKKELKEAKELKKKRKEEMRKAQKSQKFPTPKASPGPTPSPSDDEGDSMVRSSSSSTSLSSLTAATPITPPPGESDFSSPPPIVEVVADTSLNEVDEENGEEASGQSEDKTTEILTSDEKSTKNEEKAEKEKEEEEEDKIEENENEAESTSENEVKSEEIDENENDKTVENEEKSDDKDSNSRIPSTIIEEEEPPADDPFSARPSTSQTHQPPKLSSPSSSGGSGFKLFRKNKSNRASAGTAGTVSAPDIFGNNNDNNDSNDVDRKNRHRSMSLSMSPISLPGFGIRSNRTSSATTNLHTGGSKLGLRHRSSSNDEDLSSSPIRSSRSMERLKDLMDDGEEKEDEEGDEKEASSTTVAVSTTTTNTQASNTMTDENGVVYYLYDGKKMTDEELTELVVKMEMEEEAESERKLNEARVIDMEKKRERKLQAEAASLAKQQAIDKKLNDIKARHAAKVARHRKIDLREYEQLLEDPDHLCCSMTGMLFRKPIRAPDGIVYEADALASWLQTEGAISPTTMNPLGVSSVAEMMNETNTLNDAIAFRKDIRDRALLLYPRLRHCSLLDECFELMQRCSDIQKPLDTQEKDCEVFARLCESLQSRSIFRECESLLIDWFECRFVDGNCSAAEEQRTQTCIWPTLELINIPHTEYMIKRHKKLVKDREVRREERRTLLAEEKAQSEFERVLKEEEEKKNRKKEMKFSGFVIEEVDDSKSKSKSKDKDKDKEDDGTVADVVQVIEEEEQYDPDELDDPDRLSLLEIPPDIEDDALDSWPLWDMDRKAHTMARNIEILKTVSKGALSSSTLYRLIGEQINHELVNEGNHHSEVFVHIIERLEFFLYRAGEGQKNLFAVFEQLDRTFEKKKSQICLIDCINAEVHRYIRRFLNVFPEWRAVSSRLFWKEMVDVEIASMKKQADSVSGCGCDGEIARDSSSSSSSGGGNDEPLSSSSPPSSSLLTPGFKSIASATRAPSNSSSSSSSSSSSTSTSRNSLNVKALEELSSISMPSLQEMDEPPTSSVLTKSLEAHSMRLRKWKEFIEDLTARLKFATSDLDEITTTMIKWEKSIQNSSGVDPLVDQMKFDYVIASPQLSPMAPSPSSGGGSGFFRNSPSSGSGFLS